MDRQANSGVHAEVLQILGRRIAGGVVPAGAVLTLALIEDEFRVSRTVAREAVRVLEDHGMVTSKRRVGVTVNERTQWDSMNSSVIRWRLDGPQRHAQLLELMELRAAVEPAAARLASSRANRHQRSALTRLAAELEYLGATGAGRSEEYLAADIEFHRTLLQASGNSMLAQLAGPVEEILTARTNLGLVPPRPDERALRGHIDVAAGIAYGDADTAAEGAQAYIATVSLEVQIGGPGVDEPEL
ncbi:FadR/GntR family transcriptional regulator [Rathayibacter sp. Leaf296]|uniref:FadR/GntR family transcriptional regulator n=1 Tax=Rathayibacter sp. Leaf296 TaxID=1736327 RepID=UPI0007037CD8|nr:FCD domain-containing protein [Rathayibacter sp. Leaf296]KQQ08737.1 hypothetical protein ASF46_15930 [Rathayibacter sp. Leaf296]